MKRVLHLGTEFGWGGGENQTSLLLDGGTSGRFPGYAMQLAAPAASPLAARWREKIPVHHWAPKNEVDLVSAWRLARIIHTQGINLVHAHTARAQGIAWLAKALFVRSVKLIAHRRTQFPISQNPWLNQKYRSPLVDCTIAISLAAAAALRALGVPEERIAIIPSAIASEKYLAVSRDHCRSAFFAKWHIPESAHLIGAAGSLTKNKNFQLIIRALAELPGSNVFLAIAGDGPEHGALRDLADTLHKADRVIWLGHVAAMETVLPALDFFVLPSLQEGLGGVLVEAALSGTPIAGSHVGGIPELITPGETGYLFNPWSVESLTSVLITALVNSEERKKVAAAAKELMRRKFSVEELWSKTLAVYDQVLSSGSDSA